MPIDFETTTDTGLNEPDSIDPVVNGENVDEDVLQRPSENLRQRTDVLRETADVAAQSLRALAQLGVNAEAGETVTFDGAYDGIPAAPARGLANSGSISIAGTSSSIAVKPLGAPPATIFAYASFTGAGTYTVTSKVYAYQGGNRIKWRVYDSGRSTGSPVTVTMRGSGSILDTSGSPWKPNYIDLDYISGSTLSDMAAAIAGDVDANALVTVDVGADGATALFDVDPATVLAGGADAIEYVITETELAAFFNTSDNNRLQAGDVLAITFSSELQKLSRIVDRGNTTIDDAELTTSRLDPLAMEISVPLFQVGSGGDAGVLVGGSACYKLRAVDPGSGDWESFLGSTASGEGASLVGIFDVGGYYSGSGTNVESALQFVGAELGSIVTTLASTGASAGASTVGIQDTDGYYTGTTVEAALQEIGAADLTEKVSDSRNLVQYDGVVGATGFGETLDFTGETIAFSAGYVLVGGAYKSVAPFTVGMAGSGEDVELPSTTREASLIYIDSTGAPTYVEDAATSGVAKLAAVGVPLCRVSHTPTALVQVWDVRRFVAGDSEPRRLIVSDNTTDAEINETVLSQFKSFGAAQFWAEHQKEPTTATEHYVIEVRGTVDLAIDTATSGTNYASTFHQCALDAENAISLAGINPAKSILNVPATAVTNGVLAVATAEIRDIKITNGGAAVTSGEATLLVSGAARIKNLVISATHASNTKTVVSLGSGASGIVVDGLTINDGVASYGASALKIAADASIIRDLYINPTSVSGDTAAVEISGDANEIRGVIRGAHTESVAFSGTSINNTIDLVMNGGIAGTPSTPTGDFRHLKTLGVSAETFVAGSEFGGPTPYTAAYPPRILSDTSAVSVAASIRIPHAILLTAAYVVGKNSASSAGSENITITMAREASAKGSTTFTETNVLSTATEAAAFTNDGTLYEVALTLTGTTADRTFNWDNHGAANETSDLLFIRALLDATDVSAYMEFHGIRLVYTVLADDHRF